jgi:hypothetical protein
MTKHVIYCMDGNIYIADLIGIGRTFTTIERLGRERIPTVLVQGVFSAYEHARAAASAAQYHAGDLVAMKQAIKTAPGYEPPTVS